MVQPLWRIVWRLLKKLKIELPYDPAIPLLGIYPEKTLIRKDTYTPMFIEAPFTIARTWKQPKCPSTAEWIKMWYIYISCIYIFCCMCVCVCIYIYIYIHTHKTEYYSAIKNRMK